MLRIFCRMKLFTLILALFLFARCGDPNRQTPTEPIKIAEEKPLSEPKAPLSIDGLPIADADIAKFIRRIRKMYAGYRRQGLQNIRYKALQSRPWLVGTHRSKREFENLFADFKNSVLTEKIAI